MLFFHYLLPLGLSLSLSCRSVHSLVLLLSLDQVGSDKRLTSLSVMMGAALLLPFALYAYALNSVAEPIPLILHSFIF
jgi:hypothetical protein